MRWQLTTKRDYCAVREAIDDRPQSAPRNLSLDGPQVCLLYECETELEELSRRLREAKLDELPWEFVDLGPAQRPHPHREAMRRSFGRISTASEAGSVAALAVLSSHWPLIGGLMLSLLPLFLMWRLMRRPGSSFLNSTV